MIHANSNSALMGAIFKQTIREIIRTIPLWQSIWVTMWTTFLSSSRRWLCLQRVPVQNTINQNCYFFGEIIQPTVSTMHSFNFMVGRDAFILCLRPREKVFFIYQIMVIKKKLSSNRRFHFRFWIIS